MLVQKAAIIRGDKYLILLRSPTDTSYPDYWDFPGGTKKDHEDEKTGVEREVKEETNLNVNAIAVVHEYEECEHHPTYGTITIRIWKTTHPKGDVRLSKEHTQYKWATREEILNLKAEPFLREYMESMGLAGFGTRPHDRHALARSSLPAAKRFH